MRLSAVIGSGPAAVALMVFYYFIPFQIVAGGPDWLGRLRPLVLLAAVIFIALGFVGLRRNGQSKSQVTTRATLVLSLSAVVVLGMLLFPQLLANFLANLLAD